MTHIPELYHCLHTYIDFFQLTSIVIIIDLWATTAELCREITTKILQFHLCGLRKRCQVLRRPCTFHEGSNGLVPSLIFRKYFCTLREYRIDIIQELPANVRIVLELCSESSMLDQGFRNTLAYL